MTHRGMLYHFILSLIAIFFLFNPRWTNGDGCLTELNDTGAIIVEQLRLAITSAECQLVDDVTYTDYMPINKEIFDYIVIGAGSAGSVVANRLSENPNWRVLLLEAGGDPTITTQIPALAGRSYNTNLDWQYKTEPEPTNCLGLVNRSCPWPRGKVLGGSSVLNVMVYVRGNPRDYDEWASMGNFGWDYKCMLNYFKKSEGLRSEAVSRNEGYLKYHGENGYLKVESFKDGGEFFTKTFIKSFQQLGYQAYTDVNAQYNEGFFALQGTLNNSRRCSAASAFLHNFQSRTNLEISKGSFVTKILINENNTAYGVSFLKGRQTFKAHASKEVILSGGTINSPQLLMLSGIGPKEHLSNFGIKVIKDLRVGKNLQDHTFFTGFVISLDVAVPPTDILESTYQFLIQQRGDLAGVGLSSNAAFIRTSKASSPNIQFYFFGFPPNSSAGVNEALSTLGFNDEIKRSVIAKNVKKYTLFLIPALIRPRSRGQILLKSTSPFDHPLIYPGYYTEEQDVEDVLESITFGNKFVNTATMQSLGAKVERIF